MRILIVWRGLPNQNHPSFARPYYFIKNYGSKHSITLLARDISIPGSKPDRLEKFLERLEKIDVHYPKSFSGKVLASLFNRFSYSNLRYTRDFNFAKLYHPQFQNKLNEILKEEKFDIIYSDFFACDYVKKVKSPVILEFFSPLLYRQEIFWKHGLLKDKLFVASTYFLYKFFEVHKYRKFDAGIFVTKTHLELSKPYIPRKYFVIPPGVDTNYFKPMKIPEDNLILFTGSMSYIPNVLSVIHFIKKIYPTVKKEVSKVRFYVVGRSPDRRLLELSNKDNSIIITGAVNDVRPYFSKASVFVNPIIVDDGGIKNKVLEAMAMGKAIVSTSLGARDIGATHRENMLIADNPKEFSDNVIHLLQDEELRKKLGRNARKFVKKNYSWDKQTEKLMKVFEVVANENS